MTPAEVIDRARGDFFAPPPVGHFWLEHLVRTLATLSAGPPSPWKLYTMAAHSPNAGESERIVAAYALNHRTRYGMFHAVDTEAGAALIAWALDEEPPQKVLAPHLAIEKSLHAAGLESRITRDHRELFLTLPVGALAVQPDWRYRLATTADIPRLREYNRAYNEERRTDWSRDWRQAVAARNVYVRERDGAVSSCLLRGAILPPRVSFGGTFTFPEFRGLGDATMLVANFCAEMALSGLDVCLIVDDDNPAAIRVYGKVGFTPQGLYRTVYF